MNKNILVFLFVVVIGWQFLNIIMVKLLKLSTDQAKDVNVTEVLRSGESVSPCAVRPVRTDIWNHTTNVRMRSASGAVNVGRATSRIIMANVYHLTNARTLIRQFMVSFKELKKSKILLVFYVNFKHICFV